MSPRSTQLAAAGYGGLAVLHVNWARGSSWPFADLEAAADQVTGRPGRALPSAAACMGVAGLLGLAGLLVLGHPQRHPAVSTAGARGVVLAFSARGVLGMTGRTDLVSPGSSSEAFRQRDRRVYAPVCLTLALLSLPATRHSPALAEKGSP